MAFTVYPIGSASGFSEESELDSELHRLLHAFGGRMSDFIVDPFTNGHFDITTSTSSYDVDIAAGDAFTGGHLTRSTSTVTLTVDASTTNEVFLVVNDAKTGNASIESTSDGTTPSGQYVLKLWEVTTDGSGVTGTTDFRRYVPFHVHEADQSITGLKTGTTGTVDISSTGVKTVSYTFAYSYQDHIDSVIATLNSLTDTAANFGYIRTKNVTVDGFDVEAKVSKSGGSGSTADFHFNANGQ
jgi:hypothetical protein